MRCRAGPCFGGVRLKRLCHEQSDFPSPFGILCKHTVTFKLGITSPDGKTARCDLLFLALTF